MTNLRDIKNKPNNDIRLKMLIYGISARELSEEIGITPEQLHHWLDKDLSREKDKRIMSALHILEVKKQNERT